jgi:hypothetical protein
LFNEYWIIISGLAHTGFQEFKQSEKPEPGDFKFVDKTSNKIMMGSIQRKRGISFKEAIDKLSDNEEVDETSKEKIKGVFDYLQRNHIIYSFQSDDSDEERYSIYSKYESYVENCFNLLSLIRDRIIIKCKVTKLDPVERKWLEDNYGRLTTMRKVSEGFEYRNKLTCEEEQRIMKKVQGLSKEIEIVNNDILKDISNQSEEFKKFISIMRILIYPDSISGIITKDIKK